MLLVVLMPVMMMKKLKVTMMKKLKVTMMMKVMMMKMKKKNIYFTFTSRFTNVRLIYLDFMMM
jgi:hypothetical protein